MRVLLMVVSLLVVSGAYAQNVYEDPMDDGPIGPGWGNDLDVITEGDRTAVGGDLTRWHRLRHQLWGAAAGLAG